RRDDPIDESGFDQWYQRGNAKTCWRKCAGERHTDRDFRFEHFLGEKTARFAQARGVVGEKGLVDQIRNRYIFLDWRRIDSFPAQEFTFCFTHLLSSLCLL